LKMRRDGSERGNGASVIFSDRCRARLDHRKLRGEFGTELTRGESEDGSKGRFL
jgi:hypothetical protein